MKIKRLLAIFLLFATVHAFGAKKIGYGGELLIRLNEPSSFSFSPSNYSNLIFYSLIYENFFYRDPAGNLYSNIFAAHYFDKKSRSLVLEMKPGLSFSSGKSVSVRDLKKSLESFLSGSLLTARKLGKMITSITTGQNRLIVQLAYERKDIIHLLSAPELILQGADNQSFSGAYFPAEWVQNQYLILKTNPFYCGGRSYLDSIRVVFDDHSRPHVFLGIPGAFTGDDYREVDSGIYQNVYLCFPGEKVGQNTRLALYALFRNYFTSRGLSALNALTSDSESPVSINIRMHSMRRIKSVLRSSRISVFLQSALKSEESYLNEYLQKKGIPLQTVFIENSQLENFLQNTSIKYLLLEKVFKKRTPVEEKIRRIITELTFARFDEVYHRFVNQLQEMQNIRNEELIMDQVAMVIDKIIKDGFIMPLIQKRYSLYVNRRIGHFAMDDYGRPLLMGVYLK